MVDRLKKMFGKKTNNRIEKSSQTRVIHYEAPVRLYQRDIRTGQIEPCKPIYTDEPLPKHLDPKNSDKEWCVYYAGTH